MNSDFNHDAKASSPHSFATAHQRDRNSFTGCSRIQDYELLRKLGEGTFGEVYQAQSRKDGSLVALKKIIMHNEKDGFPITALREIRLLKLLSHPNVLRLVEMAVEHPPRGDDKRRRPVMYMVTPYMDHDLSGLLDNPSIRLSEAHIKCYMVQLFRGLQYLHDQHILHRDMKAANLLINNKGVLQIADFGLARHYSGSTPQPGKGGGMGKREYTSLVVTRWYRPPELLMYLKTYTTAIDVWGVGCIFGEMLTKKPILAGESDSHQLELIFDLCGTPTDETMPGWRELPGSAFVSRTRPGNLSNKFQKYGSAAVTLLRELLKLDWKTRINAGDALEHPYFRQVPFPTNPRDMPVFEESHELDRRKVRDRKAALPPAPKGGTVGRGPFDGPDVTAHNKPGYPPGGDGFARNGTDGTGRHGGTFHHSLRNGHSVEERRPAWQRDRSHHLPPRPPPPADYPNGRDLPGDHRDGYRDRDRLPRRTGGAAAAGGGSRPDVDTYIPSYGRYEDRDDWPARRDWDRRRDYDDRSRDSRSRSPTMRHRDRDREMYCR